MGSQFSDHVAGGQQGQLFNLAVLAVGLHCPEVRAVTYYLKTDQDPKFSMLIRIQNTKVGKVGTYRYPFDVLRV